MRSLLRGRSKTSGPLGSPTIGGATTSASFVAGARPELATRTTGAWSLVRCTAVASRGAMGTVCNWARTEPLAVNTRNRSKAEITVSRLVVELIVFVFVMAHIPLATSLWAFEEIVCFTIEVREAGVYAAQHSTTRRGAHPRERARCW